MSVPLPPDEPERLAALSRYEIDLSAPLVALDRVAGIAKGLFDAPIALVTIVGEEYQRFVSRYGIDRDGTAREDSFCTHALVDNAPMVVADTLADARFEGNPLVVGEPGVRYYAGVPLVTISDSTKRSER